MAIDKLSNRFHRFRGDGQSWIRVGGKLLVRVKRHGLEQVIHALNNSQLCLELSQLQGLSFGD